MLIPTPYTPAHPNAGLRSPPSQRDTHVVLLHLHVQICHANESGGEPEESGKLLSQIYEQRSTLQHAQPGRTHLRRLYRVYLQIVNMCMQTDRSGPLSVAAAISSVKVTISNSIPNREAN